MDQDQAAWYLAGLIDGEGCVHFRPADPSSDSNRRWALRQVQISNSDLNIITAACAATRRIPESL